MIRVWPLIRACAASLFILPTMTPADTIARSPSRDMVSWVVLASSQLEIDLDGLRQRLDAAFPGEFWPPDDRRSFIVADKTPGRFLIRSTVSGASGLYLVHIVPGPYTRFSSSVRAIADPDLRKTAIAQCCWISIDRIDPTTGDREAYRFIGGALAQLAPDDAAVLLHPARGNALPFDAAMRQRLAAGLQPD